MKTKTVNINGIAHNVCLWGSPKKPKLFFFHGWMDMGASFEFVAKELQDDYYCIAPDWRGFGQSAHTKNKLGYFFYEYVADTHEIFNAFADPSEKVQAVGHSMGGNIVALYAGAFPERLSRFVNVEGFGIQDMPPEMGPERIRKWMEQRDAHQFRPYKTLKEVAQRLQKTNPRLPSERALFLAKHLCKKVRGGFKIAADPRHKHPNPYLHQLATVYAFWEKIQAQCLLVVAEKTEMASWVTYIDDIHSEIQRRLDHFPKNSRRELVKDCGHMVHHEKPEILAGLLRDFLKS